MKSLKSKSSFGIANILGLVFILVGIVLILSLIGYNLPLGNVVIPLQYGAAIGSILVLF